MNNLNMAAAMNATGGPVGGMQAMNNGQNGGAARNQQQEPKAQLNTYIYDYFIKNELYDCARALLNSDVLLDTTKDEAGSRRRDADGNLVNGVDENAMDADTKDDLDSKRPDDLPMPAIPAGQPQNSFLHDWWCLFWDICVAQRKKPKPGEVPSVQMQYVQHTQQQQRLRQEQNNQIRGMDPRSLVPQQLQNMMRMQNGMNMSPQELQRTAMQNSRKATPQNLQIAAQLKQHQQMQRDGSNLDMNGDPRPQSPASGGENAPSPSKRPRLDNGFAGQGMGPNGRVPPQSGLAGQQVSGAGAAQAGNSQAHQLLMQHGINPSQLTAGQFQSFQQQNPGVQAKSIAVYAQNLALHQRSAAMGGNNNMVKGMPNAAGMPNQSSPVMQPLGGDGQQMGADGYYNGNTAQIRGMVGAAQSNGNHALQDYQMQLMLLEQQNKKRLMQARQDQGGDPRAEGVTGGVGQAGFQAMSPQGSRSGPSPNPSDQMKRGTPKMGQTGLPGSPLPDGGMPQQRASPTAMNLNGGQMQAGMTPPFSPDMMDPFDTDTMAGVTGANGQMMRPPSSHPPGFNGHNGQQAPPEFVHRQQNGGPSRLPSTAWQHPQQSGQPPIINPQQGQQLAAQQQAAVVAHQAQQAAAAAAAAAQASQQAGQAQQAGTPQQRTAMPPPQAPAATSAAGKQPASPQQAAPPTPQPANKANPKAKKETKKAPRKKASTANLNSGATPSADADPPPTPTPSTPITPSHPNSFSNQKGATNGPSQTAGSAAVPASVAAPAGTAAPLVPAPGASADQPFGTLMDGSNAPEMSLDFDLHGDNVLESFDFDSFLNTEDGGGNGFGLDMPSIGYGNGDGLEAGSGDV